jgi:chromosome segregation ATPase
MNEQQTTFLSRIGKWFKGDADGAAGGENGDQPLVHQVHRAGQMESRSTFLRPWAKRDAEIANLREGFTVLTDLMTTIRDNLEKQGGRQDELLRHLAHLPEALRAIPEGNRVQSETLRAIHQQIEHQSGQQQRLADILSRISDADAQQRSTLDALKDRVETLNQHDQAIADNLNHVGSAMQTVSRTSQASAQVLEQMRDNVNSRDGELERILSKQGTRFTTMLAIAIFLSIAALVAVSVIGYLGYVALQRTQ